MTNDEVKQEVPEVEGAFTALLKKFGVGLKGGRPEPSVRSPEEKTKIARGLKEAVALEQEALRWRITFRSGNLCQRNHPKSRRSRCQCRHLMNSKHQS